MLMRLVTEHLLFFVVSNVGMTSATCELQQKEECLEAATTGTMSSLKSSGECSQKDYLKFSHVCLVSNYSPDVNHCCCTQQSIIMCCPYRQTWNHFRCSEALDTVGALETNLPGHNDVTFISCAVIGCLIGGIIVSYFVLLLRKRLLKGHWCNGDDVIISNNHETARDHELPSRLLNRQVISHYTPRTDRQPPPRHKPRPNPSSSSSSSSEHRVEEMTSSSSAKNLISPKRVDTRYQSLEERKLGFSRVDFVVVDCRSNSNDVWQKQQAVKVLKLTRFQDGSSLL